VGNDYQDFYYAIGGYAMGGYAMGDLQVQAAAGTDEYSRLKVPTSSNLGRRQKMRGWIA
jgi:hypothetical protein